MLFPLLSRNNLLSNNKYKGVTYLDIHKLSENFVKKQPPDVFYEKSFSWKFRKIHRKAPVPESLF